MSAPPAFIAHAEKAKLIEELKQHQDSCLSVKGAIQSIVTATLASSYNKDTSSDSESVVTIIKAGNNSSGDQRSLESIHQIISDDEISSTDSENVSQNEDNSDEDINADNIDEDIPGLKKLLELISEGKIKICQKVLNDLIEHNIKINALSQASSEMQDRWQQIINTQEEQEKKIDGVNQYLKLNNLLLHKFHLPKNRLSSLEFSIFIAEQLNYFLPQLPVPVHWSHISDAHPLKTKSKKSNVIIVRFCNRNIRHMIYENRDSLPGRLMITEHLTEANLGVLKRAKDLFGFHNAWTDKCNIIVYNNGNTTKVNTIQDVNELFENATILPQNSSAKSANNYHRSPKKSYSPFINNRTHAHPQKTYYDWGSNNTYDHRSYNGFNDVNNSYHNSGREMHNSYPPRRRGYYSHS